MASPLVKPDGRLYYSLRLQDDRSSGKVFPTETGCQRVCAPHPALPCLFFQHIGDS